MVCTSLGSLLRPLFYFLCYIHFSLSVCTVVWNVSYFLFSFVLTSQCRCRMWKTGSELSLDSCADHGRMLGSEPFTVTAVAVLSPSTPVASCLAAATLPFL